MKNTNWNVKVLHPVNKNVLEEKTFRNVEDVANHYQTLPLSTWRNISIGRSKIYNNFIRMEKLNVKDNQSLTSNENKENDNQSLTSNIDVAGNIVV